MSVERGLELREGSDVLLVVSDKFLCIEFIIDFVMWESMNCLILVYLSVIKVFIKEKYFLLFC